MPEAAIIDIHCHAAGIGAGDSGCFVSPAMRKSWRFPLYLRAFGVSVKDLQTEGDQLVIRRISQILEASSRVSKAVVLAMDGVVGDDGKLDATRSELYIPDEFIAGQARRYANLLFGASINPLRRDALERLDWAAGNGAVLVKWLPAIQEIDPSDRRFIPFYRRLAELGLPLLCHTGEESSFTRTRNDLGDPELLRLPLAQGVTVIAAHAASNGSNHGERNHDRFVRLCSEFPNLYADISALTQANRLGHLERLLRHKDLHGRLLYGTDFPLINTGITSPWFHLSGLGCRNLWKTLSTSNPWDQDVILKGALGVTEEIFANNARLFTCTGRKGAGETER